MGTAGLKDRPVQADISCFGTVSPRFAKSNSNLLVPGSPSMAAVEQLLSLLPPHTPALGLFWGTETPPVHTSFEL